MRHLRKGRKFGRERNQRRALMKSMASSFFMLGRIKTTEAKAKELRPYVEKFLTRAKNHNISGARHLRKVFSDGVVKKVFERAKSIEGRSGGYTRVVKAGLRKGDGARMAILELVK